MPRKPVASRQLKAHPRAPEPPGPELTVDHALVAQAEAWIKRKVGETVHRGLLEIGDYLFEKFYDRDIERVRLNNPRKHVSFRALAERCDTLELPVSRSTLYNAVSVAVMGRLLPDPAAFKQLPSSHQTALLPLRDPAKVDRLAHRAKDRALTVRELRQIVSAEVAIRDPHEPPRGRPKLPVALKALRRCAQALSPGGARIGLTKAQLAALSDGQAAEVQRLAERAMGELEKVLERVRARTGRSSRGAPGRV